MNEGSSHTSQDAAGEDFLTNDLTEAVIRTLRDEFNEVFARFIESMQQGNAQGGELVAILYCLIMEQMNAGRYDDFLKELDTVDGQGSTEKLLNYYIRQSPYNIPENVRLTFKSYRYQIIYAIEMLRKDFKAELSVPVVATYIHKCGGIDQLHREWNKELTFRSRKRREEEQQKELDRQKEEAQKRHAALEAEAAGLEISVDELQLRRRREKAEEIKLAKAKRKAGALRHLERCAGDDDGRDGILIRIDGGRPQKLNDRDADVILSSVATLLP